ncbi:CYTH domain protein [Candidatus Tiddalikarchaeum anstoanum]|nr:CYTH domain protein [Candidatus Tiddalikarchaeum anstoanum]
MSVEDESKFYIREGKQVITELERVLGTEGEYINISDTYFKYPNMPKGSTLRIRECEGSYTPTLKIQMDKNKKRLELEDLVAIGKELGVTLNSIGDISRNYERMLTIEQRRYVLKYNGVEFAVDNVQYLDNKGNNFFEVNIFEAELKDTTGDITRRGVQELLSKKKLLIKPCKQNKYELGMQKINAN